MASKTQPAEFQDKSAQHIAEQHDELAHMIVLNAATYGLKQEQTEKLFMASTLGAAQESLVAMAESFFKVNAGDAEPNDEKELELIRAQEAYEKSKEAIK